MIPLWALIYSMSEIHKGVLSKHLFCEGSVVLVSDEMGHHKFRPYLGYGSNFVMFYFMSNNWLGCMGNYQMNSCAETGKQNKN